MGNLEVMERYFGWGAIGATSIGGLLYLGSAMDGHSAQYLETLPVVRRVADIHKLERRDGGLKGLKGLRVAATGKVVSAESLSDTLSKQPALIAKVTEVESSAAKQPDNSWLKSERTIREVWRSVPLQLDLQDKTLRLEPNQTRELDPVLDHAVTVPKMPHGNLLLRGLEAVVGYVVSSVVEKEHILQSGTEITVQGELVPDAWSQHYSMQPHGSRLEFSRDSVEQQIRQLKSWSSNCKAAATALGLAGGALGLAWCVVQGVKLLRRRKQRRMEEQFLQQQAERRARGGQAAPQPGREGAEQAQDRERWQCIVCWEAGGVQTVFPGCGHVAVCRDCAQHLTSCPMCRTPSTPRLLFFS